MPATWTTETFSRPGVRLRYHRGATRRRTTVVLLHGVTDNGLCWLRVARALDADYDVVMTDARGHGETESDARSFTMGDMVDDVAALVEALGVGPAVVVGHSMGGMMATDLAARHPGVVAGLVLEDPAYRFASAGGARSWLFGGAIRLGAAWNRHRSEERIERSARLTRRRWHDDDRGPWARAQYQFARQRSRVVDDAFERDRDWSRSFPLVVCPTLLITASRGLVDRDEAAGVVASMPRARSVEIADAGHNVRRDNYADFMGALVPFLAGHAGD